MLTAKLGVLLQAWPNGCLKTAWSNPACGRRR